MSGKENSENANPRRSGRTPVRKDAPAVEAETVEISDESVANKGSGDCEQEYDALLKVKITGAKYDYKVKSEQQREWINNLKRALTYWHDEASASHAVCAEKDLSSAAELEVRAQMQDQIDGLQAEIAVRTYSRVERCGAASHGYRRHPIGRVLRCAGDATVAGGAAERRRTAEVCHGRAECAQGCDRARSSRGEECKA